MTSSRSENNVAGVSMNESSTVNRDDFHDAGSLDRHGQFHVFVFFLENNDGFL